jgi:hypothetical protein
MDKKSLIKNFGKDEYGFAIIPNKYSNVKISRSINTSKTGECSYCFPHGIETSNSNYKNFQKNWKKFRNKQYHKNKKINWKIYRHKMGYYGEPFDVTNLNFDDLVLHVKSFVLIKNNQHFYVKFSSIKNINKELSNLKKLAILNNLTFYIFQNIIFDINDTYQIMTEYQYWLKIKNNGKEF